jgi:hypothetical protein
MNTDNQRDLRGAQTLEPDFKQTKIYREQMKALRGDHSDLFNNPAKLLRTLLNAQASGAPLSAAGSYALALDRMDLLQAQYATARDNCRLYLMENFKDRSIFSPQDGPFSKSSTNASSIPMP